MTDRGTPASATALFELLWDELVAMLGTAATATLVRRSLKRAAPRIPELAELHVDREGLDYTYALPASWREPGREAAAASTTTVMGGTGTGKTVLGLQYLADGARRGEPGALLTLEETPGQIRSIAAGFRHGFAELERKGLLHIRYTAPIELSTDEFLQRALDQIERLRVRRVVLDSLTSLALGAVSERRYKELVYAFAKHMRVRRVTALLTMEITELLGSGQLSGHGVSFASDNLLQLRYVELGGRLERALSIIKARGVPVNTELRAMKIGPAGVEVSDHNPYQHLRGVLTGLPSREGGGA